MLNIKRFTFAVLTCLLISSYVQATSSGLIIHSIHVIGNYTLDDNRIVQLSGLEDKWRITKDDLRQATRNLWAVGIFSDIKINSINHRNNAADLTIWLEEYSRLNNIYISGARELGADPIKDKINLKGGMIISPYKLYRIRQNLKDFYISEGYLTAHIKTYTIPTDSGLINLLICIDEGKEIEIKRISFHGNRAFDDQDLKKVMQTTKEDEWYRTAHFSEQDYKIDLERIVHHYKTHGFRDAEIVKDSIFFSGNRSDLYIDIWLDEGIPYYVTQVEFEGNSIFSDRQLGDNFIIKPKVMYNTITIKEALSNLKGRYYERGYFYTTITAKEIPLSRDSIRIIFVIDEKNAVKVRNVEIAGNTFSKDKIIRRQLRVLPGQNFKKSLLARSVRDLLLTNNFSHVHPHIQPVDEKNVDIVFTVKEKRTSNTDFSGGWSEQTGFTGGISLQTNNFLGNGQSVGLQTDMGQNSNLFLFNYMQPWFLDKPVSIGLSFYYKDQNPSYTGYNLKSTGGIFRIGHKLKWHDDYFHMDWIYKLDRTLLSDFSNQIIETNPMGIINQSHPLISGSITNVIRRNTLDTYDFPRSGSLIALSNEFSGGLLGGDANYHKHQLNVDWYRSLSENFVIRSNFIGGILTSFGENGTIPYLQRFFLGGGTMSSSIPLRGYIDPISSESNNKNGGTAMMKCGLELRYRVLNKPLIYVLTFAEAGETWNKFHQVNFLNLRRSMGFGLRIDVPFLGLIGVDFAYGFDTFNPSSRTREGLWQIHFIIGKFFGVF